jgi:hypothetical protein
MERYILTCNYDGQPHQTNKWIYADALQAFENYSKFVDHGFAVEYATVNLSLPNGKMYTKVLYRDGRITNK